MLGDGHWETCAACLNAWQNWFRRVKFERTEPVRNHRRVARMKCDVMCDALERFGKCDLASKK